MLERKVVNKQTARLVASVLIVSSAPVGARTVGELLKNIETKSQQVKIQKKGSALPAFQKVEEKKPTKVNLSSIKPPSRSTFFYEEGTDESELEKVTDQGISQLYKLSRQFVNSTRRGEIWLRLAELYVEKARLLEYRIQSQYDEQAKLHYAGKLKTKPKMNLAPAQEYNKKAIQLYEWFLRDFPRDPKTDQALYFLGYNYFQLAQFKKGSTYYARLSQEFPQSPFVDEANFALGEYYFDNEDWKDALKYYSQVSENRKARLYSFAFYKSAWCLYKTGQVQKALSYLEQVIKVGKSNKSGVNRIRLASEAIKDLVVFYAEAGDPQKARSYFEEVAGEKNAPALLEKLAYRYVDTGNKSGARAIFRSLIEEKPNAPKAFDYQYQLVSMYSASGEGNQFKEELSTWLSNFGPGSAWAKTNAKNKELMEKSNNLMESTVRNYILQKHQIAQVSKAPAAQKGARIGYDLYFATFKDSAKLDEMHFFYGELLYDMQEFNDASSHYLWVADNAPKSKYNEKSIINAILSLEKSLPTPDQIKKTVGQTNEPVEFDAHIKSFEKMAQRYFTTFPKGEETPAIKYRLASLYYYYNQFDRALPLFEEIMRDYPKTEYAEYSANLNLDIYNLRKDYEGLEKSAQRILAEPSLANSKVGTQIRDILQKTSFKKAQDLEKGKDFATSAKGYEEFAKTNAKSDLAFSANYNAAVNYERAGDITKAASMYAVVISDRNKSNEALKNNAVKFLAIIQEKTGQYAKAAQSYEAYVAKNPKDKEAVDFTYNAAIIRDGMNAYPKAAKNYEAYYDSSKKADRNEVHFLIAKMYERQKRWDSAIKSFEQYLKGATTPAGAIEATFTIAQINERLKRKTQAEDGYKKTLALQRRLSAKQENVGASFAAEAKFKLIYKTYEELRAIRIPNNPAEQGKAVQKKLNLMNQLKEELKTVIKFDDGNMMVAALTTMGQAQQHMAASLYNAPKPKGLDADGMKEYEAGIDKIAKPFADEAKSNYVAAIEKGQKLESYNDWSKVAYVELAKLIPETYNDSGERAIVTKVSDPLDLSVDSSDEKLKALATAKRSNDEELLVKAASDLLSIDQNNLLALNTLGLYYFEHGKLGLAKIIFNRALAAHPDNSAALHNNLGVVYLVENNQRKAITSFKKALEAKPDYRIAAANLGSLYLEYKDYGRAVAPLEAGYKSVKGEIKNGGTAHEVAGNYALALAGTGNVKKARSIYADITENNPRNPSILLNYAILLVNKAKDTKEAKSVISKLKLITDEAYILQKVDQLENQMKGAG